MSHLNIEQINGLIDAAGIDYTREILETFWRSTEELMADLQAQLASGNFDMASQSAHAIKGSAANVGAMGLESVARDIEQACRVGDAEASDVFESIITSFEEARTALEAHLDRYVG